MVPVVQADSGSQHQIAALQAEIAALKAQAGFPFNKMLLVQRVILLLLQIAYSLPLKPPFKDIDL